LCGKCVIIIHILKYQMLLLYLYLSPSTCAGG
jgi:hypothetical protein